MTARGWMSGCVLLFYFLVSGVSGGISGLSGGISGVSGGISGVSGYYDITTLSTMTSLPSLLCYHYPHYYDVTTLTTMASLPLLLWRHYPHNYDVTTMTPSPPTPPSTPPQHKEGILKQLCTKPLPHHKLAKLNLRNVKPIQSTREFIIQQAR